MHIHGLALFSVISMLAGCSYAPTHTTAPTQVYLQIRPTGRVGDSTYALFWDTSMALPDAGLRFYYLPDSAKFFHCAIMPESLNEFLRIVDSLDVWSIGTGDGNENIFHSRWGIRIEVGNKSWSNPYPMGDVVNISHTKPTAAERRRFQALEVACLRLFHSGNCNKECSREETGDLFELVCCEHGAFFSRYWRRGTG